jgi:hypothetical protein
LGEKQMLLDERAAERQPCQGETDRVNYISVKLQLLNDRIVTAKIVAQSEQ